MSLLYAAINIYVYGSSGCTHIGIYIVRNFNIVCEIQRVTVNLTKPYFTARARKRCVVSAVFCIFLIVYKQVLH